MFDQRFLDGLVAIEDNHELWTLVEAEHVAVLLSPLSELVARILLQQVHVTQHGQGRPRARWEARGSPGGPEPQQGQEEGSDEQRGRGHVQSKQ